MSLLYLTFLFPLLGWLVLAFSIGRLGERSAALPRRRPSSRRSRRNEIPRPYTTAES